MRQKNFNRVALWRWDVCYTLRLQNSFLQSLFCTSFLTPYCVFLFFCFDNAFFVPLCGVFRRLYGQVFFRPAYITTKRWRCENQKSREKNRVQWHIENSVVAQSVARHSGGGVFRSNIACRAAVTAKKTFAIHPQTLSRRNRVVERGKFRGRYRKQSDVADATGGKV